MSIFRYCGKDFRYCGYWNQWEYITVYPSRWIEQAFTSFWRALKGNECSCVFSDSTTMGTLQSTWLLSASRHRRYFMLWLHRLHYHAEFSLRHASSTRWFPCPDLSFKPCCNWRKCLTTTVRYLSSPRTSHEMSSKLPPSNLRGFQSPKLSSLSPFPSSLSSAFPPLHPLSSPMRTCSSPSWESAATTSTHKGLGLSYFLISDVFSTHPLHSTTPCEGSI